jgi:NAD+-dependent secondary alcohol dehydrogenase Adh1
MPAETAWTGAVRRPCTISSCDASDVEPGLSRWCPRAELHRAQRPDAGRQPGRTDRAKASVDRVRELTSGAGAEAVIDFVGERDAVAASLAMDRARGTYFIVGYGGELRVPTFSLVLPEISVVGNAVGTHLDLRELVALTSAGSVSVRTKPYPLDAFADAVAVLEHGTHGRAVLVP